MSSLLSSSLKVVSTRSVSYPLAFLSNIALARVLGLENFGHYSIFLSSLFLLATFSKWGWDSAAIRFVSQYGAEERPELVKAFIVRGFVTVCGFSVLVAFFYLAIMSSLAETNAGESSSSVPFYMVTAGASIMVALSLFFQGVLRGGGHPVVADLYEVLLKPIAVVLLLVLAVNLLPDIDMLMLAVSVYCLVSLAAAVGGASSAKDSWLFAGKRTDPLPIAEWWNTAIYQGLATCGQVAFARAPVLIMGFAYSAEQAGLLAIAMRLAEMLQVGLLSVALSVIPKFAAAYHGPKPHEARRIFRKARQISAGFAALAALLMISLGRWVLSLFGTEFTAAYWMLVVLVIGQTVLAMFGPVAYVATMTGHQKSAAKLTLTIAAVMIPVCLLAAMRFSPMAVVIVVAIGLSLLGLGFSLIARKALASKTA